MLMGKFFTLLKFIYIYNSHNYIILYVLYIILLIYISNAKNTQ